MPCVKFEPIEECVRLKCGEILHDNCGSVWFACTFCNLLEFSIVEDYLLHINREHLINNESESPPLSSADQVEQQQHQYNPFKDSTAPTSPLEIQNAYKLEPLPEIEYSELNIDSNNDELNTTTNLNGDEPIKTWWDVVDEPHDNNEFPPLPHRKIRKHIRAERTHLCKYCNKGFLSQSGLDAHSRHHTFDKPYKCEICLKRFSYKVSLTLHKRIHNEEMPFLCTICGKCFRTNNQLSIHTERVHKKTELIDCNQCNRTYRSKYSYEYHVEKVHSRLRLECDICGSIFKHRKLIVEHMYLHLKTKRFKCRYCESAFAQSAGRYCHEKNVHQMYRK